MYKEIIIIFIVIALIVGVDVITNNYTKDSIEVISKELNILRENILEEDKEEIVKYMKIVKENWEDRYKTLAFYIEHDELEKVETELTALEAKLSVKEYKESIENLDTTLFILHHIQEKEEFHLRSIF